MENVEKSVSDVKEYAQNLGAKTSENHKAVMAALEEVRAALNKQQGFINGAAFTVRGFWIMAGIVVTGIAAVITGKVPPNN
jgi:hypothetical protein